MRPQVPPELVERLRALCRALPEAREETAWAGVRWTVRRRNFAHLVRIGDGWPPAYARAARTDGPVTVLTFRSRIAELDPLNYAEPPFFRPVWFRDIVGMTIDDRTDWGEVAQLLAGSYSVMAPRELAAMVDGVSGAGV